jgi:hypothetical protein
MYRENCYGGLATIHCRCFSSTNNLDEYSREFCATFALKHGKEQFSVELPQIRAWRGGQAEIASHGSREIIRPPICS